MQIREGGKTFKTLEILVGTSLKMFVCTHFVYCDAFRVLKEKKENPENKEVAHFYGENWCTAKRQTSSFRRTQRSMV